jgi:AcrR family transcriptional regulator
MTTTKMNVRFVGSFMPRLKPATQTAKREHILDAAELCFARAGFHGTSMQDICRQAEVSAGSLYVYFRSKEDLIAGIAERDRAKIARQIKDVADAPDLVAALKALGEHYSFEEPAHKRALCIEIGAEATRNPKISEIYCAVDRFVMDSFIQLFERARQAGRIRPDLDSATLATVIGVLGDGLFWRRAVNPDFDPQVVLPVLDRLIAVLLNPVVGEPPYANDPSVRKVASS